MTAVQLSWDQVFAWRMRRHFLDGDACNDPVAVVRRLAGVQAQVASSADLAIAVRGDAPAPGAVSRALDERRLVKTWAMRGTLHLLPHDEAGAYLALVAAGRSWERASWQRAFGVTPADVQAMAEASAAALDNRILTRDQLVEEIVARTGNAALDARLRSGWGTLLKPLAWQGHLCHGPSRGNRVTFTSPATWLSDWAGTPPAEVAAPTVISRYLAAHGPATVDTFDRWLTRGASRKADLRAWFGTVEGLTTVEVEGTPAYALLEDVDDLAATAPSTRVRLLPGFDQYVLAAGTHDGHLLPAARRADVSRTGGWIAPVVIAGGRVAGTWEARDGTVHVALFPEAGPVATAALEREAAHLSRVLGRRLRLA